MKRTSRFSTMYRYITIYSDSKIQSVSCELVHFAASLPLAIKYGRAYVRDMNRQENCRPGMKRYHYEYTYRAR